MSHEDLKVEFIRDVIYIHSSANLNHERIFGYLLTLFNNKNKDSMLLGSRFPLRLKDGKRVEPDLMYLSRIDIKQGNLTQTVFEGEPSLIVEIISPNYRDHDINTKLEIYRKRGV